ncbi:DUF6907 domain-containing protein [Streptomyces sp. NPDC048604]|uniref:DUF6907 domain-containing protein n=1 Tax=Streptomyces sp. NPDC048604 TaxID=3365578 RepID=UPI00371F52DB
MSTTVSTRSRENSPTPLATRFVPAVVSGTEIQIQCPAWCTIDHVADSNGCIEDVWHSSDHVDLKLPHLGDSDDLFTYAYLGLDPTSSIPGRRKPFVLVEDGGEGYHMSPDQADRFADNLEAFAARIREMARVARIGGAQ